MGRGWSPGEVIRARHRGKAVGFMQAGWAVGWGAAALLYALFFSIFPVQTAWRVLFLVGLAPRYWSSMYAATSKSLKSGWRQSEFCRHRRTAVGTRNFPAAIIEGHTARRLPRHRSAGRVLRRHNLASDISAHRARAFGARSAGYLAVLIAGSFTGYLVGGLLADRIGRRLGFLVFAIGAGTIVVTYTMIPFSNSAMLLLGFPLGFFASGVLSGMGAFFTEIFRPRVRGVGQGFTYNVGRAAGALFPTLVGILSARMPLGEAIGLFAAIAYATRAVSVLLPETKGKVLAA